MNNERKALLDEANSLELEFAPNVKNVKLKEMIAEAKGEPAPIAEVKTKAPNSKLRPRLSLRERIAAAKKRALKLHIVTITNLDKRENDVMTTVSLSFENSHFSLARNVPLDIPIELEQSLIDIAASTTMTMHKDEILNGRRTGNKTPVSVKKFAINYGKPAD